jgi:D-alanyl-D-alanine-carboxypeptidase/D-alanyl-D-alanine-endopeptidase
MKSNLSVCCSICAMVFMQIGFSQNNSQDQLLKDLGENFVKGKQNAALSVGVYNNGKISYYNYGSTEAGNQRKPDSKTVYEIGSVTKSFVSLILANSIIEKRINLEDDIRKYLDGNYQNLEFNGKPITIAHLANTTSGIPNWLPVTPIQIVNAIPDSTAFLRERIYGKYTKSDFFDALHQVTLDTIPGFKTRHSNAAAQLLTYILEDAYNTSIEKLVADYITVPNKMENTSFLASKRKNKKLAFGYDGKGNKMPYFMADILKGAAGLNSTTSDLVNFIKLQLDHTNKAVALSQAESFNAGQYSIGLNWLKYKYDNGNHQIWTDGGTYGFVSYVVIYPEINSGVVVLANVADDETFGKISTIAYKIFEQLQKK